MFQQIISEFEWLRNYRREDLKPDFTAGLIVAIMLIPQGMAYAMLAGLPPMVGLYASTLPLIIYALFGSSQQLAVGPVAMMSLLVFAGVSPLAQPGSEEYINLVLLLSFMVGGIQFLMGLLRLGFIVNFLSHAVIRGFTSAAAILILVSQLHHIFGMASSGGHSIMSILRGIFQGIGDLHPTTLGIGLTSIAILLILKWKIPKFPAPLLVAAVCTGVVYFGGLPESGVKIVGHVPRGLPPLSIPRWSLESMELLFPAALTIVLIGFMESISIAEWVAAKEKNKIDSNRELIALGLANVTASLFSAYPVTGGFSRTAVNYQAGAKTRLASLITASLILLTLVFFTSVFYHLPHAALAAIVIVAVVGLIDVKGAIHLFHVKKMDGWTMLLTFVTTLLLGSETGIILGVVFSLFVLIWRSSHPHTAELGYLKEEDVFRNIHRYPQARTYPEALILRVDASLYFANMSFLEDFLRRRIVEKPKIKWVVMDLSGVNDMDAVAAETLSEMMDHYREQGIQFIFSGMKGPIRDLVSKAGWREKYGKHIEYLSIQQALKAIGLM